GSSPWTCFSARVESCHYPAYRRLALLGGRDAPGSGLGTIAVRLHPAATENPMTTLLVAFGALVAMLVFAVPGASAAEEYRIGYLNSFSGYLANMGTVSRDGFLLAIEEINKRGGANGRQLKVIVENDESDPSKGVPAAIRLIHAEKVLAIVGPARSDVTEPLGPIAAKGH